MGKRSRNSTVSPFSVVMRKLMEERKLNAKLAADMAGVARSTFSEWLNGAVPSNLDAIANLAMKLGVSFEYLLLGKVVTQQPQDIKDIFEIADETSMSGLFQIEIKRLKPRNSKEDKS